MDIAIEQIRVQEGQNPRQHWDHDELEELIRSVRAIGVIQPITVQQAGDDFVVVAGHRRLKAAQIAGLATIPVHILEDGADVEAIALVENTVRADMSPAEECDAALRLLAKNKGDQTEVALTLGWTESKLRRRLALGACTPEVRKALAQREIKLGMAELLATVPNPENQNKALAKVMEQHLGIEQVRASLLRLTQQLSSAIFDKTECQTCRYNTAEQATLFTEALSEDAYCTHVECFGKKTLSACQAKAESLKSEYPLVRVLRHEDVESITKLTASGPQGVGAEQLVQCHQCAEQGATVSALAGTEGSVEIDICFNLDCHKTMVAAQQASLKVSRAMVASSVPTGRTVPTAKVSTATEHSNGIEHNQAAPTQRPQAAMSTALKDYRRKVWNAAAMRAVAASPAKGMALLPALIIRGQKTAFASDKVRQVLENKINQMPDTLGGTALVLDGSEHLDAIVAACAATALPQLSESDLVTVLRFLQPDLGANWRINAGYMGLLTKSELAGVMEELGVAQQIPHWKKLAGGKKQDLIDGIASSGVDLTGLVPANFQYIAK